MKMAYLLKIAARTNYNTKYLHSIFVLGDNLSLLPFCWRGEKKSCNRVAFPKAT